jgi:hypothetical protein
MAGRLYFARVAEPPPPGASLKLPATPQHAALRRAEAGDFLFLIGKSGEDPLQRAVLSDLALTGPPVISADALEFPGALRVLQPARTLPLATAHRFLHDGSNGPADFPGDSDGEKIDAALLYSECFMDPNVKGSVPKIVHFWRWLNGGE